MNMHHITKNDLNQTVDMELKPKKEVDFVILSDILMVGTPAFLFQCSFYFPVYVAEHMRKWES